MANNVTTRCIVTGPSADIDGLVKRMIHEEYVGNGRLEPVFDFNGIIPMPRELVDSNEGTGSEFGAFLLLLANDRTGTVGNATLRMLRRELGAYHETTNFDFIARSVSLQKENADRVAMEWAPGRGNDFIKEIYMRGPELKKGINVSADVALKGHEFCLSHNVYSVMSLRNLFVGGDLAMELLMSLGRSPRALLNPSAPIEAEHLRRSAKKILMTHMDWHLQGLNRLRCTNNHGFPSWYWWSQANWGTKRNSYDLAIVKREPDYMEFTFDTAWSFPGKVFERLSAEYPKLLFDCMSYDDGDVFAARGVFWGEKGELTYEHVDPTPELYKLVYGKEPEVLDDSGDNVLTS